MGLSKKITFLLITFGMVILPSFAKIEGEVSKGCFYDTERTIMNEIIPNETLKTGQYWEKNLFYFNKYRPLFMLSNKELYDLMPKEQVSVVQRITAPSIYNISLKTASIKTVSLSQPVLKNQMQTQKKEEFPKIIVKTGSADSKFISIYEQAKNPQVDPEQKIETAILLKKTKNKSNYSLAIDLLNDVIRKEPYNAYAFYLKGELYSEQKDSQNAMKNYVEALKLNPASKQCCLGIAKILEPTNKVLAQKYYNKAGLNDEVNFNSNL